MRGLPEFSGVLTFPSTGRNPLVYIPYLDRIEPVSKTEFKIFFNGGEVSIDLRRVESILFYGASGAIPLEFLDAANQSRVPITFHRTHLAEPYVLTPTARVDRQDVLTRQILTRESQQKRLYVAKQVILARIRSLAWMDAAAAPYLRRVRAARDRVQVQSLEAEVSRRYWSEYYARLGLHDLGRRDDHPINQALDAGSRFLSGILLRWILFHKLSPSHGFMHEPTNYIALAYDLIEPYRVWIERACADAFQQDGTDRLAAASTDRLKRLMDEAVYVGATRQIVRRKALLHGVVLALRAYLVGNMQRLIIPQESPKRAGRPLVVSYRLIGEIR